MNNTGMPAFRPTANFIWNSFRSSGKRHLVLTGGRGSGKTTLLAALCPQPLPGITTWAEPKKAVFLRENLTTHVEEIGVFDPFLPGPENRMAPVFDGFIHLGVPALRRCAAAESEWVTIDEIGYLESDCPAYRDEIRTVMDQKQMVLVVRKQGLPFVEELCSRPDVFVVDLDAPYGHTGCIIMASGLGKRFGGNKLMADFRGQPLIARVLDATEGIFTQRVVVTRHPDVDAFCRARGIRTILHTLPYRSDTVRLGMEVMIGVDRCMFCPGDQPLLTRETVAAVVMSAVNDPGFIWRTCFEGTPGSPVIFPAWAFPELRALPDGKGGGFVAKKYPERLRTVNVRDKYELMDVDCPDDLQKLLER